MSVNCFDVLSPVYLPHSTSKKTTQKKTEKYIYKKCTKNIIRIEDIMVLLKVTCTLLTYMQLGWGQAVNAKKKKLRIRKKREPRKEK